MENIIITGVNGLLGQKLLDKATANFSILGVDIHDQPFYQKKDFKYLKLDITDRRSVKEMILKFYPHFIINTAAMTDVDGCEIHKEQCWKINVEAVENIVYAARKIGSKIVQISTDYIFDGKSGPYNENENSSPLGYYGKSKLASENVLIQSELDHAVLRTMILYGFGIKVRANFVTWLISALKRKQKVTIVTDQMGSPTLVDDLAAAIIKIIQLNKWDTFHIAGSEIIDRYSFAHKIAEIFGLDKELIFPITTADLKQKAPRPLNSGLVIEKAE